MICRKVRSASGKKSRYLAGTLYLTAGVLLCLVQGVVPGYADTHYSIGGFQPSVSQNLYYYPGVDGRLEPERNLGSSGFPGFNPQWQGAGPYAEPYSQLGSRGFPQGYQFRDDPNAPVYEDRLPKFRPNRYEGRSPYAWGGQAGSIGPAPVFRPLDGGAGSMGGAEGRLPGPSDWGQSYPPYRNPSFESGYPGGMRFRPLSR